MELLKLQMLFQVVLNCWEFWLYPTHIYIMMKTLIATLVASPVPFVDATSGIYIASFDDFPAFTQIYIQAFAVYNIVLTPTQISLVTNAMAAL